MVGANVDLSQITPDEWESLLNGEKYPCQVNHCSFIWGLAIPQLSLPFPSSCLVLVTRVMSL